MDYMAAQMDRQIEGAQLRYDAAMADGQQPAFPVASYDHQTFAPSNIEEEKRLLSGMTLRDYFAAKAMQAYVTRGGYPDDGFDELISKWAYEISDAMLAARSA